jgi:exo-beta-1,3-glucanase (GH17 family)
MKKLTWFTLVLGLAALVLFSCKKTTDTPSPNDQIQEGAPLFNGGPMGVCYGPYHLADFLTTPFAQAPGTLIPPSQIDTDLGMIATYFNFFRTYTLADGLDTIPYFAQQHNLQVALGVWVDPGDTVANYQQAVTAVRLAKQYPDQVKCIVVGNEPSIVNTPLDMIVNVMSDVYNLSQQQGITVPITACIDGGHVGVSTNILNACTSLNNAGSRYIFLTIYPYYGQVATGANTPGNIQANMEYSYTTAIQPCESAGLTVIIGEMGWPSGTQNNETAGTLETPANMGTNYAASLSWVNGNNQGSSVFPPNKVYTTFWFEMFDEPWKINEPNGVGPCWGVYYNQSNPALKFTP